LFDHQIMGKPQAKISKQDGSIYYERIDLVNYALDLQDRAVLLNRDNKYELRKAVDGSLIFYINGKLIAQEHPGVPALKGKDGFVCLSIYRKNARRCEMVAAPKLPGHKYRGRKNSNYHNNNKKL